MVHISGTVAYSGGGTPSSAVVYTLPEGLRPAIEFTRIADRGSSSLFTRLNIKTDGGILVAGDLTNITFLTLERSVSRGNEGAIFTPALPMDQQF